MRTVGSLSSTLIGNIFDRDTLIDYGPWFLGAPIVISCIRLVILFSIGIESPYFVVEKYAKKFDSTDEQISSDELQ